MRQREHGQGIRVLGRWGLVGIIACASPVGCGADHDTTGQVIEDPIAAGLLPADWPGTAMGIAPPVFRDEGKAVFVRRRERSAPELRQVFPSDPNFEHVPANEVILDHAATGRSYHVTLPDQIDLVAAARATQLAQLVTAMPTAPEPSDLRSRAEEPRASTAGEKSVFGEDTRVRLGIRDGVPKDGWMAAIGFRLNGSTGVLIAPNAYLTVAHAVYDSDGNIDKGLFYPREDWVEPETENAVPWGAWDDDDILVPAAFKQNNCHIKFTEDCVQYDIALVKVVRDASGKDHRWWFTPAAETRQQLESRELRNRGYPACVEIRDKRLQDATDRPLGCDLGHGATLWGDRKPCALGRDRYPAEQYSAEVFHTCDTNGGHSGSPMFYYVGDGAPVLVGLHSTGDKSESGEAINSFKRFSPNTLRWINGLL